MLKLDNKSHMLYHHYIGMLIICFAFLYLKTDDPFGGINSIFIDQLLVIYCLVFLLFSLFPQGSFFILFVSFICLCASEVCLGLSQLLGYRSSNHFIFNITGSFTNPGPYGGFLAISIILLTAYSITYKNDQAQNLISKLLYWSTSIIAIVAFIILPSTQSRSAILALGCSMILLAFGTERIRVKIKPIPLLSRKSGQIGL